MTSSPPVLPNRVDCVMYHQGCADGFGACWALHQRYGDAPQYLPVHHSSVLDLDQFVDKVVLMVDVSLPRNILVDLAQRCKNFMLIDHHITAQQQLGDLPYCYFDLSRSGAGLAWDLAHPQCARPPLIDLVETRDLWKWDRDPHARNLTMALDVQGFSLSKWSAFNHMLSDPAQYKQLLVTSQAMRDLYEQQIQTLCADAIEIRQLGLKGFAANVPHIFASDVGSRLSAREPGAFGFTWCLASDGQSVRASWRSAHADTPVMQLAQEYEGGGGHRMAAGATLSMEQLHQLLHSVPKIGFRPK